MNKLYTRLRSVLGVALAFELQVGLLYSVLSSRLPAQAQEFVSNLYIFGIAALVVAFVARLWRESRKDALTNAH